MPVTPITGVSDQLWAQEVLVQALQGERGRTPSLQPDPSALHCFSRQLGSSSALGNTSSWSKLVKAVLRQCLVLISKHPPAPLNILRVGEYPCLAVRALAACLQVCAPAWIQPPKPVSVWDSVLNPTCSSPGSRCQNLPSSSTYTAHKYTHRAVMSPPPAGPDSFTTTTPSPAAPDPFFLNIFPSTRKLLPFSPVHCPPTHSHKTICMAHAAGENNDGVQSESWPC